MAPENRGPWSGEPDPPPRRPRGRVLVLAAVLIAIFAGVSLLAKIFPGELSTGQDKAWLLQSALLVALVSAGILTAGKIRWGEAARHAAIWIGIVGVLVLIVTYRDELAGVGQRVRAEFSGSYPVATGAHELVVIQGDDGGYYIMGQVNGQPVRFLIDTGATDTVLSPADADRLGLKSATLLFNQTAETANGVGYGAAYTADSLAVGAISFADFPMVVNQAPMRHSLLGMSFLKRLESFQVRGRKLYLKAGD